MTQIDKKDRRRVPAWLLVSLAILAAFVALTVLFGGTNPRPPDDLAYLSTFGITDLKFVDMIDEKGIMQRTWIYHLKADPNKILDKLTSEGLVTGFHGNDKFRAGSDMSTALNGFGRRTKLHVKWKNSKSPPITEFRYTDESKNIFQLAASQTRRMLGLIP